MPRVARPKPPCIECGKPSRKLLRCETCAKRWTRQHAADRCSFCGAQTANPAGGQRRGRKWTTRSGPVITCRGCLPAFLEDRRPEMLEALAAIIETDRLADAWLAKPATLNASGYGRLKVPGTREKIYAHHAAFALFHGPWTAGEQIHHRTQDPAELSPWTLEAVSIAEHETRKQLPPDHMPVEVPRLEELATFAKAYGLPLPWGLRRQAAAAVAATNPAKETAMAEFIDLATRRTQREQATPPPIQPPRFSRPSNADVFAAWEKICREEAQGWSRWSHGHSGT